MFSVVIPAYRERELIATAVGYVLAQTEQDFEVIVVDDGSDDGTADSVPSDPRVRVVRQPHAGPYAARNRGVAEARNGWVAWLDADDRWRPDHLAELGEIRRRFPDAALIGTAAAPGGAARDIERIVFFERMARDPRPLFASSFAASREAMLAVGGFGPHSYGEETDLFARLALRYPVAVSSRFTVEVRFRPGSVTASALERWKGADLRSAADITPAVATVLAADPRPPGALAFADRQIAHCLRTSIQIGDVATVRSLRALYHGQPPWEDRVLLALGSLPGPVASMLGRAVQRPSAWRRARKLPGAAG